VRAESLRQRITGTPSGAAADLRLRKACADFEAMLVKQLLATAHVGESEGGVFETDGADETLSDLRLDSLAGALTKGRGFGVAAMLERQLAPHRGRR
jgi:Rod binding domain-containing protein